MRLDGVTLWSLSIFAGLMLDASDEEDDAASTLPPELALVGHETTPCRLDCGDADGEAPGDGT